MFGLFGIGGKSVSLTVPFILPNYEYDIFISYRQNDNRSGWVSEFVKDLQEELAAVIKYPVSVYFDSNPRDGLLETHSVDKTLEGKLKCLIFIPVISQTYCDPTSFAWNNEFLAFRNLARNDPYTLNIRLSNGNMASRILPIRIHDIDPVDQALFEKESGGAMRAIDFIFRSPGVNRPLRSKDDDVKEIAHSLFYRDQINKIGNAVRDLLIGLKNPSFKSEVGEKLFSSPGIEIMPSKRSRVMVAYSVFSVLAVVAYFIYTDIIVISDPITIGLTILLIIGPVLYYFIETPSTASEAGEKTTQVSNIRTMTSKRSEAILATALFSVLAVASIIPFFQGVPYTIFATVAFLLPIGPVLYYLIVLPAPSKRIRVIVVAVIFSVLSVIVHIMFRDFIAITLLLIIGPAFYYYIGKK